MTAALAHVREFRTTLPDGRVLRAFEGGDPTGPLVIYHHGTPMSGLLERSWVDEAVAKGLRIVGYDRAGYGGSTRLSGRVVADVVGDIAALADSIGVERFFTWGVSGGGPHALACAALLPDRVLAAGAIASVAPYGVDGLDFLAGMGQDNIDEFGAAIESDAALEKFLAVQREGLLAASAEDLRLAMDNLLPEVDKAMLTGEFAEFMHAAMTSGLRHSLDGWFDDDLAFVNGWGFEVAEITVPLLIAQGEQDLMVPYAHGQWLAGQVPAATTWMRPDDGHVSLGARVGEVLDWLLTQASAA